MDIHKNKAEFIPATKVKARKSINNNNNVSAYFMLAPQIIGFVLFTIYPIYWVFRYAFFDFDGYNAVFVGFDNFIRLFTRDPQYWGSLLNTFIIAYGKLIIELPIALIIAVLINEKIPGRNIFRVGFFMPNVISSAVIGLVFAFIFSSFNGVANSLLMQMGLLSQPHNWFSNKWSSMFVIIMASVWQAFGANVLFLLAGLQNIPLDLYEAAKIDGASKTKVFFHITLPMLMPVMQIVLMLAMVNGMKIMDLVKVLTNGMPAGETDVVMLYIYKYFFESGNSVRQYGYASSLGVVTSIVIGIITMIYLKISKKASNIY